jgi:hypothetical protein
MQRLFFLFALILLSASSFRIGPRAIPPLSSPQIHTLIASPSTFSTHLPKILIPRVSSTPNNTLVRTYIVSTLNSLGWHVELDEFEWDTPLGKKSFSNIIATKDTSASRRVALAAHYDSKYFAPPHDGFLGATDSAFSCALLLDLAETLNSLMDEKMRRLDNDDDDEDTTLQLIFFDGEEAFVSWTDTDSIYGARHLAERWEGTYLMSDSASLVSSSPSHPDLTPRRLITRPHQTLLSTIEHLILLDLLGAPDPHIKNYFKDTAWLFARLKDTEERLASLGTFSSQDEAPREFQSYFHALPPASSSVNFGYMGDDHVPFLKRGVPVLHLITEPFPRVWHTPADDASALDQATMNRWNVLMRIFVAEYLGLKPVETEAREGQDPSRDELS